MQTQEFVTATEAIEHSLDVLDEFPTVLVKWQSAPYIAQQVFEDGEIFAERQDGSGTFYYLMPGEIAEVQHDGTPVWFS